MVTIRRPREAGLELTGPSERPSVASRREGETTRRVDLGEGLEDTTRDLANEVTLERICSTIKVGEGPCVELVFCSPVTRVSESWN